MSEIIIGTKNGETRSGPDWSSLACCSSQVSVPPMPEAMITPVRERYTLNIAGGPDIEIQGNILSHEYKFEQGGRRVAEVSQKWFRVRDTYGVEIEPGRPGPHRRDGPVVRVAHGAIDLPRAGRGRAHRHRPGQVDAV